MPKFSSISGEAHSGYLKAEQGTAAALLKGPYMEITKNVYLICGDEDFLREQKKKELLAALHTEGSMNFNAFDGPGADLQEAASLSRTLPFLEERRVILLEDTGLFKARRGRDGSEDDASDPADPPQGSTSSRGGKGAGDESPAGILKDMIEELPETTVLLISETAADAGSILYKLVKKNGEVFSFKKAEKKSFREAEEERARIRAWALDTLKKEKRRMDSRTLDELLNLTGYDMMNLSNELEKLISYTFSRPENTYITSGDIEDICSRTVTDRVFDMMQMKLSGNAAGALRLYEDLLAMKTSPMKVLRMLQSRFSQALIVRELLDRRESDTAVCEKTGLKDWQLKRMKNDVRRQTAAGLRALFEKSLDMELSVKEGSMPDVIAVELVLSA